MRVLAISAHPDDETLGCGGTLLKHRDAGDCIFWVIATQPHEPGWDPETIERKAAEVERVAEVYGVKELFRLGFPAARLDVVPLEELMTAIGDVMSGVAPDTVYVVHGGDVHTDHQAVFGASMSVLKPFRMDRLGVSRVLAYESLSSTDAAPPMRDRAFVPQVFSDISDHIDRKVEIMKMYETEVQCGTLPRTASAIRALARYRGATIGVECAEAFALMREIA